MSGLDDDRAHHRWLGELLDLPADERRTWLEQRLPDDPELRNRLLAVVGDRPLSSTLPQEAEAVRFDVPQADAPAPSPAPTPETIGRYRIIRPLGAGGMGQVFLARDPNLNRNVAIKLLLHDFDSDDARERFWREARAAGSLGHGNIVRIFDLDVDNGRPFIVMEYIPGRPLSAVIAAREPLTIAERLIIIEALCAGLACAHDAGIVHRDIKPANVMLGDDGAVRIVDFGIAKTINPNSGAPALTREQVAIGTVGYIAPEHLCGRPADARSDMFATAVVAYELITYGRPFGRAVAAISQRIMQGDVTPMRTFGADIPASVERIVAKGLSVAPENRFRDMMTMRRRIAEAREDLASASVSDLPSDVENEPVVSPPRPIAWLGAAAGMGVLVVAGLLWSSTRQTPPARAVSDDAKREAASAPTGDAPTASRPHSRSSGVERAGPDAQRPRSKQTSTEKSSPSIEATAVLSPTPGSPTLPSPRSVEDDGPNGNPAGPAPVTARLDTSPGAETKATAPVDAADAAGTPGTADTSDGGDPKTDTPSTASAPPKASVLPEEDRKAIHDTLKAFEAAFEAGSTPQLRALLVEIALDEVKLYERRFLDKQYRVRLDNVRLAPKSPTMVTARCSIERDIVSDRGDVQRQHSGIVFFELYKQQDAWVIARFRAPAWW